MDRNCTWQSPGRHRLHRDTAAAKIAGTIGLGGPLVVDQRRGERLFYTSKFSFQHEFGCASCHLDSTIDGLHWTWSRRFRSGYRDNRSLEDISNTAPFKWNGGNPDLFTSAARAPSASSSARKDSAMRSGRSRHLRGSIPLRPTGTRSDGELTAAQERGKASSSAPKARMLTDPRANRCYVCHSASTTTSNWPMSHCQMDDRSPMIDVPHLTNIALSAPYCTTVRPTVWRKSGPFSTPKIRTGHQ